MGAVQLCSANRIGHGVRIVEDIDFSPAEPKLGRLAGYVRDWQIPLELCPSSNVQTGAAASIAEHPFDRLYRLGFRVTVNSDNQLMSGTNLSREFALLAEAFDYTLDDLRRLTLNAAAVTFVRLGPAAPTDRRRHPARLRGVALTRGGRPSRCGWPTAPVAAGSPHRASVGPR